MQGQVWASAGEDQLCQGSDTVPQVTDCPVRGGLVSAVVWGYHGAMQNLPGPSSAISDLCMCDFVGAKPGK